MNAQTPTIRKFNPGTHQSDEEVIRQFVVRERELQIVLRTLANNVDAACCQHLLLTAPRGRGKTMMLARVGAEMRTNGELSPHYLPIRFMEESQEIFSITDFWLETLFHLAKAVEKHDAELSTELAKAHTDYAKRWTERDIAEHVRATVLTAANKIGKKLLLMVENLQSLSGNVDEDFGWQLRETLQCEPQIVLLATATSRFAALDDAKEAFFELFRTINLKPLDTSSCRRLWQAISGGDPSNKEIRPLQILTGGSPRFLVIMGEFSRHRSMRQLLEELVTLIDDHTEYFRNQIEALAKQESRVFVAAADLWQPSTTGEIAARARMEVRKASTLIGRLVNRGALVVHGSGRKQSYSVAERLYCIYYKLRRERDEAALVHSLIHFMAAFYSDREFAGLIDKIRTEAVNSPAIREGLKRGGFDEDEGAKLAQNEPHDEAFDAYPLAEEEIDDLLAEQHQAQLAVEAIDPLAGLHNDSARKSMGQVAEMLFNKGVAMVSLGKHDDGIAAYDEVVRRFGRSDAPELSEPVARALLNKGVTLGKLGRDDDEIAAYDEVVRRFGGSDAPELSEPVAKALLYKGLTLWKLGRDDDEMTAYDEVVRRFGGSDAPELSEPVAKALLYKGLTLGKLGRDDDGIAAYDKVVRRFGGSDAPELSEPVARALLNKGVTLGKLGRDDDEIAAYDEVVRRFGGSDAPELSEPVAKALLYKGLTLGKLGRDDDEMTAYDEVVRRFGGSDAPELSEPVAKALLYKGLTLGKLGRDDDGIAAYDKVVRRFGGSDAPELSEPVARALLNKGVTLGKLGRDDDEIAAYDEVVRRFGGSDAPELSEPVAKALLYKGVTLGKLGRDDDEIAAYDEVVRRFGGSDAPELSEPVARALLYKGLTLWKLGRDDDEMTAYDEVVRRFGGSDAPELSEPVAKALLYKGLTLGKLGRDDDGIAAYDEVVRRFGGSDAPNLQTAITSALIFKARAATKAGRPNNALTICDDIERRVSLPAPNAVTVMWLRAEALILLGQQTDAMCALEAAYEALDATDNRPFPFAFSCISNFIGAEADERRILAILTGDEEKSTSLLPLIVALRRRLGEEVHVPPEVHEVAKDIMRDIEERSKVDVG